jgi:outer membrane protein assembly factor BamB
MTRLATRLLLAIAAVSISSACHRERPPAEAWRSLAQNTVLLHIVWRADLSTANAFSMYDVERGGLAATAGVVAVATSARGLVGLDAATGAIRWEHPEPAEAYAAPPGVAERRFMVPGPDGTLRAVDAASGRVEWESDFGAPLHATPTASDDYVCAASTTGAVRTLEPRTGRAVWSFEHPVGGSMTMVGDGACTVASEGVYVGFSDGTLAALTSDGRARWLVDLGAGEPRFVDVDTQPLMTDELVVAASFSGGLVAFDRESGAQVWRTDLTGATSPLWVDGSVVTTTAAGSVVWLDPANGDVRYELALDVDVLQAPVRVADILAIASPKGVFIVDAHAPWVYHRFEAGSGFTAPVASDGTYLYALSDDGFAYALELRAY